PQPLPAGRCRPGPALDPARVHRHRGRRRTPGRQPGWAGWRQPGWHRPRAATMVQPAPAAPALIRPARARGHPMRTAPRPAPRLTAGRRQMHGTATHAIVLATTLMLVPAAAAAQARTALPEEGRVVAGQATVVRQDQTLTVTQQTRRAILEWRSFDI